MSCKQQNYKIFLLPWLAHGHISPFLGLAKRLIQRDFHVFLCSTPVNLEPLRKFIDDPSLELVDLHLSSAELAENYHTTKNLPPHLMPNLKTAFDESKENFRNILRIIKPDIIIYDFLLPWAPEMASEEGIGSTLLLPCGAACISFFTHYSTHPDVEFPLESLRFSETQIDKLCGVINEVSNGIKTSERLMKCFERSSAPFILFNSSNQLEARYISYLSRLVRKEIVSVGFLLQEPPKKADDEVFLNWLSKKNPKSVVFVSFGSEYFLTKEETEEVALGLEMSGACFFWVIRFHGADKKDLNEVLPQGFLQRIGDRGMIVEGWAPQAEVLRHSSVGGFLSHCGWNSVLEAIICRVPIIAMPMQLDQPINSRLITELGIGVEVPACGERFTREEISSVIKKVVVEEGKKIRMNVDKLSSKVKENCDAEMNETVKRLVQLAQG